MKILLVDSPPDKPFQNIISVPSPAIIALYSTLPNYLKEQTYFIDGNLTSVEEINGWIKKNKPEHVGISSLVFGYQNAIKIGEEAKNNGATVTLGGKHATEYSRIIEANNRPFHHIIEGQGQIILKEIIEEGYSHKIIKEERSIEFPVLDYSILQDHTSPEKYWNKMMRLDEHSESVKGAMSIITQLGCIIYFEKKCKMCSIGPYQIIPYDTTEESLINLVETTKADYIYVADSNLTRNQVHLKELKKIFSKVKQKTGKDFKLYGFSRVDDLLRPGIIKDLKQMGIVSLFIGYEHSNDDILKSIGKGITKEKSLEVTNSLADEGITLPCAGIVLGTPGETKDTLDEIVTFAEELKEIGNVKSMLISPLYPFPNTHYWRLFYKAAKEASPILYRQLRNNDILEMDRLALEFHRLSHLMPGGAKLEEKPTYKKILKTIEEVHRIIGKGIVFMPT